MKVIANYNIKPVTFLVNNTIVGTKSIFSRLLKCRYDIENQQIYLLYINASNTLLVRGITNKQDRLKSLYKRLDKVLFPTSRRITKRELNNSRSYKELKTQIKDEGIILREVILSNKKKYQLLNLIWIYYNINAKEVKEIPPIDLLIYHIIPQQGVKPYKLK